MPTRFSWWRINENGDAEWVSEEVPYAQQEIINGDAFSPLAWPEEYRKILWAKPIDDKDSFKLMLFCLGNGCSPNLIYFKVDNSFAELAAEQGWKASLTTSFILNNVDEKRSSWFYFDVDYGKWGDGRIWMGYPKRKRPVADDA